METLETSSSCETLVNSPLPSSVALCKCDTPLLKSAPAVKRHLLQFQVPLASLPRALGLCGLQQLNSIFLRRSFEGTPCPRQVSFVEDLWFGLSLCGHLVHTLGSLDRHWLKK
ncbi:hypothetical protein CDAR_567601 [Caerostris darwini]|uniref:Uncharacterized protein n=1 Tax=Caerostris darwini TaxID=1538125 RepID=A0AAV4R0S5_9ARAC|nr:hypothetical protein CDAR_567601 [Caerostris darwini]